MGDMISIIHGRRARRDLDDGTRLSSRCGICRDETLRVLVRRLRTDHPGGPLYVATVLQELNRESSRRDGPIFTYQQLEHHLGVHESDTVRIHSIVRLANRQGSKIGTRGVPADILVGAPRALDPSLPVVDAPIRLASLIRRAEETLGRIERRLDNSLDETLDVDHPTALAAQGYLFNVLRNYYATLHKICDPRRMVMLFLVKVARAMMDEVVAAAQQCFHELAVECVAGLEPADRIRVQAAVVNRGRAFASALDSVASAYDAQLAQIATGEEEVPIDDEVDAR